MPYARFKRSVASSRRAGKSPGGGFRRRLPVYDTRGCADGIRTGLHDAGRHGDRIRRSLRGPVLGLGLRLPRAHRLASSEKAPYGAGRRARPGRRPAPLGRREHLSPHPPGLAFRPGYARPAPAPRAEISCYPFRFRVPRCMAYRSATVKMRSPSGMRTTPEARSPSETGISDTMLAPDSTAWRTYWSV